MEILNKKYIHLYRNKWAYDYSYIFCHLSLHGTLCPFSLRLYKRYFIMCAFSIGELTISLFMRLPYNHMGKLSKKYNNKEFYPSLVSDLYLCGLPTWSVTNLLTSSSSGKKSDQFSPPSVHMAPTFLGVWWGGGKNQSSESKLSKSTHSMKPL